MQKRFRKDCSVSINGRNVQMYVCKVSVFDSVTHPSPSPSATYTTSKVVTLDDFMERRQKRREKTKTVDKNTLII